MNAHLRLLIVVVAFGVIVAAGATALVTSQPSSSSSRASTSTSAPAAKAPARAAPVAFPQMKLTKDKARFELAGVGFLPGGKTLSVYVKSRERVTAALIELDGPLKTQQLFQGSKCTRPTVKERSSGQQLRFTMPTAAPRGTYSATLRVRTSDCRRAAVRAGAITITFSAGPPPAP